MRLEDYFNFVSPDEIRIKGHRICIEDVIHYYLDGYTPEQIQMELPSLKLEKIYATITYYLHNQTAIETYLLHLQKEREKNYQNWLESDPSEPVKRIRQLKAKRLEKIF